MLQLLHEILKNRELIWALAVKELRVRYKRSALGFLWALLNPLLMMVILTMVFSSVEPGGQFADIARTPPETVDDPQSLWVHQSAESTGAAIGFQWLIHDTFRPTGFIP